MTSQPRNDVLIIGFFISCFLLNCFLQNTLYLETERLIMLCLCRLICMICNARDGDRLSLVCMYTPGGDQMISA